MKIVLISTLGSNCVVQTCRSSSKVLKWYSSGKVDIMQSIRYYWEIASFDEVINSKILGRTVALYTYKLTPSRLERRCKFSPTVSFKSTLSFSLLDFSAFPPDILIQSLFISVKLRTITLIASLISPPSLFKLLNCV